MRFLLALFISVFFIACESPTYPSSTQYIVDTIYVKDTISISDTISPDTVKVSDTIISGDTLIIENVLIIKDTQFIIDTLIKVDTVYVGDSLKIIESIDTVLIIDTVKINNDTLYIIDTVINTVTDTINDTITNIIKDTVITVVKDTVTITDTIKINENNDPVITVTWHTPVNSNLTWGTRCIYFLVSPDSIIVALNSRNDGAILVVDIPNPFMPSTYTVYKYIYGDPVIKDGHEVPESLYNFGIKTVNDFLYKRVSFLPGYKTGCLKYTIDNVIDGSVLPAKTPVVM